MATDFGRARDQQQRAHFLEQIDRRELPGNDASWFEALVADQASESTKETANARIAATVDTATTPVVAPETQPATDDVRIDSPDVSPIKETAAPPEAEEPAAAAPADEGPEITTTEEAPVVAAVPPPVADDSPLENTSEMVGQLWTSSDSSGPLDGWEPEDIDRKISSSRSFRWPTVIGIVAVLALITTGLVLLPSITESRADEHLDMITTALRDLRAELPDSQVSLAVATDPASTTPDLAGLTTQLTELAAKASALDTATQAALPKAPPLTSSAAIDAIEPIRQRAEPLGTIALTIQRRISNVVEYRALMNGFLVLPELPNTADSETQAELRVELASAQADSASILAELPSDVSLDEHKALARDVLERFATWQVDYLEALRIVDTNAADTLIAELEAALVSLDEALITPLAQIRRQTDADLIDLARAIDDVVDAAAELRAG